MNVSEEQRIVIYTMKDKSEIYERLKEFEPRFIEAGTKSSWLWISQEDEVEEEDKDLVYRNLVFCQLVGIKGLNDMPNIIEYTCFLYSSIFSSLVNFILRVKREFSCDLEDLTLSYKRPPTVELVSKYRGCIQLYFSWRQVGLKRRVQKN